MSEIEQVYIPDDDTIDDWDGDQAAWDEWRESAEAAALEEYPNAQVYFLPGCQIQSAINANGYGSQFCKVFHPDE